MQGNGAGAAVEVLFQANATLAEGPIWDGRTRCLYWVDIRRARVSRFDLSAGRQTGVWIAPSRVGCVALTTDPGTLLVAAGATISTLDLATGGTETVAELPIDTARFRANDGRVDRLGRLWIGTMIDDIHAPDQFRDGQLFRVDPDSTVVPSGFEFELPNGLAWSGDGSLMYLNDTTAQTTYVFDYDLASGAVSNRRVLYDHGAGEGFPDGLSIDADGNLWSAQWDGWNIRKISPEARLLAEIPMPVRRPSSASFFGDALDRIVVTSATVDFQMKDFIDSPDAGSLFTMPANATGVPENLFQLQN
ncbi:MAG: SMP-30/gluconolactonase/LRE family protein [Pseudomonadota bacterium]